MDFLTLKDKFLGVYPDYGNDISNFLYYMENIKKLTLPLHQDDLVNSMRTEAIIKSLEYFIEINQIKKQEPARKYFVSVGQLFEFVLSNSDYKNSDLKQELGNPATRVNSYSRKTNEFIDRCKKLSPKETQSPLTDDEVSVLIEWCDKQLIKDFERNEKLDSTRYKRISACLCIKLMILTGITYREARKLCFLDLDIDKSTITINDFIIRLPKMLSCQFREFYKVRTNYDTLKDSVFLFNTIDGKQWGEATSTSGIPGFMKTALSKTTIMSITKYGITQLINSGINDSIIMGLTGASREILNDCIGAMTTVDREREINSKIVNTDKYYKL